MCWCHCIRPWGWPPVGSGGVLRLPRLGGSGPPLVAKTQFRGCQWVALPRPHHEQPTSRIYFLCLPGSLLGPLCVLSNLPRASLLVRMWPSCGPSQLTPAPVLSAVSHPLQHPGPLWSNTYVHHPSSPRLRVAEDADLKHGVAVTASLAVSTVKSSACGQGRRSVEGELGITADLHSPCLPCTLSYHRSTYFRGLAPELPHP